MMPPTTIPPPAGYARLAAFLATQPTAAELCATVAAEFSALSRDAYRAGDESNGDRLYARAIAWGLASETDGELPRPWSYPVRP